MLKWLINPEISNYYEMQREVESKLARLNEKIAAFDRFKLMKFFQRLWRKKSCRIEWVKLLTLELYGKKKMKHDDINVPS